MELVSLVVEILWKRMIPTESVSSSNEVLLRHDDFVESKMKDSVNPLDESSELSEGG